MNDTTQAEGLDGARARHDRSRRFNGSEEQRSGPDQKQQRNNRAEMSSVCLRDIEPQAVDWLWSGRVARSKLTLFAGDPGLGKSQLSLYVAARISTGEQWPDGGRAPVGTVVILSAEDGLADTVRPRLEAAGANLNRIHAVEAVIGKDGARRTFSLQDDLDRLGKMIAALGDVSLVIIDPITAYMGDKVDTHRTSAVRSVLAAVADFAESNGVAVLAISHPPKAAQVKALHAITGSLAFVAAARLVFIVIEETETDRRLLLSVKNNLGAPAAGLGFRLVQRIVTNDIVGSYVNFDSAPVVVTANEALANAAESAKGAGAMREAREFLCEALADGPKSAADMKVQAEALGIAERTLKRARKSLGIVATKGGFDGGWMWSLPGKGAEGGQR